MATSAVVLTGLNNNRAFLVVLTKPYRTHSELTSTLKSNNIELSIGRMYEAKIKNGRIETLVKSLPSAFTARGRTFEAEATMENGRVLTLTTPQVEISDPTDIYLDSPPTFTVQFSVKNEKEKNFLTTFVADKRTNAAILNTTVPQASNQISFEEARRHFQTLDKNPNMRDFLIIEMGIGAYKAMENFFN
ncbi:unnamed protein product [Caenorhabditis auriculariae]|uniref:Uncharacterized protein n=1 Tax=Caenorhabditis auriculariae TaxID=2777116 RepID=A0A8S1HKA5_9PELO|nr:unnamed protein product [Caenorhabditis auriculariae]